MIICLELLYYYLILAIFNNKKTKIALTIILNYIIFQNDFKKMLDKGKDIKLRLDSGMLKY